MGAPRARDGPLGRLRFRSTRRGSRPTRPKETFPPMATESTLLIVKPDGVRRGLVGEVIRRVEAKGLTIEQLDLRTIERGVAEEHYGEHRDKPFFGELVDFITSGPVVVAKITGEDAITCWRTLMGPTNPVDAPPGSVRGALATVIERNVVHGSDSPESAARELQLFFG